MPLLEEASPSEILLEMYGLSIEVQELKIQFEKPVLIPLDLELILEDAGGELLKKHLKTFYKAISE